MTLSFQTLVRDKGSWTRRIRGHLREPAFWAIQAGVILISLLHLSLEAGWVPYDAWENASGAHHIPVILYLIPVTYAGLVYGWEGGVFTGLWAGALASLNVVLFSLDDFQWVVEVAFAALVLGMGIAMALPVERERRQRHRAESAVRRLEALNEMALIATASRAPRTMVESVLSRLAQVVVLDDAVFGLWRTDGEQPSLLVAHPADSKLIDVVLGSSGGEDGRYFRASVTVDETRANLVVSSSPGALSDPEIDSFLDAVTYQLALQVENAMLQEQERSAMSRYVQLVTQAQEEERRRLSRDLHDGPAQRLAMLVRSLEGADSGDSGNALHWEASAILDEVRRVARDQRPSLLDDLGIVAALEWLVAEANKQVDAVLELAVEGEPRRLPPEIEVALYRIAQEAVRNAERHSGASLVDVAVDFSGESVTLSVADNGRGFPASSATGGFLESGRLGLMGMHERAELVGGWLRIESAVGAGTTVTAQIPLE